MDQSTIAISVFGVVWTALQIGSLVFRRHTDKDSDIEAIKVIVTTTQNTVAALEVSVSNLNNEVKSMEMRHTVDQERNLDTLNAVNTTLHRRVDDLSKTVRGNGVEGLVGISSRHEAEIDSLDRRVNEAHETLKHIEKRRP